MTSDGGLMLVRESKNHLCSDERTARQLLGWWTSLEDSNLGGNFRCLTATVNERLMPFEKWKVRLNPIITQCCQDTRGRGTSSRCAHLTSFLPNPSPRS